MKDSETSTLAFLRPLRNRNFSLLWTGAIVSATGYYVANVVFEWYIYGSSHQALYLTIFGVVEFVPTLTIGVFAGALVDRFDRRRLMITADLARAATMGALAMYVLTFGFSLPVILAGVVVVGVFGTIDHPSSNAILPAVLSKEALPGANGLLEAGSSVAGFIGSPVGGALILAVGVGAGLIFNATTFAISALMIGLMIIPVALNRTAEGSPAAAASLLSDVRAGFRFLLTHRALLALTLGGMVLNFFTFYLLYVVVYVTDVLRAGPGVFGILVGAQSAGYAVGALLIAGRLRIHRAPGLWIPILWGLDGVPLITMILVPVVPIAVASFGMLGVLSALTNVTFISTVQKTVPDAFLGRFFATDEAGSYSMIPAGLAFGGVLIVAFGVGFAFVLAGVGTLVTGLVLLLGSDVRKWGRT